MAKLKDMAEKYNIKLDEKKDNKSQVNQNNDNSPSIKKRRTWLEHQVSEEVCLIEPDEIKNWEFHDRPESELGDIQTLADDFCKIGQQQPCVVRPTPLGSKNKYELIIGERRWRAAKLAGIKLKVIIKEMTDHDAALSQAAENDNRKDLSDYAKGISYANLIDKGILTQKDLIEKLSRSKQYVSSILSFSKIPDEIISSIGDMSKISCRTAETIKRLSNKGQEYIDAIISKSAQLKEGKIGHNKLPVLIDNIINNSSNQSKSTKNKIYSKNGRHIFTWRNDNNNLPSLHFPKDISELMNNKRLDTNSLTNKLLEVIEIELSKLK
ncbi:ParB/RepB/Spo0J family partition protein [Thiotrichales bacterium 19S3-7]|nr:ParB/RepB/Spo0J family partition protein [Thiotrichales bacterium 19S3-7]MCF6802223.1 ParB/RepB/Spo0J family partition protein [Thiotrichales bacterium 19S3-11]